MTTAYTPILQLALPVIGELNGVWGTTVNDNITSMIEQAIAGLATVNTWTAASHTLTTANGTTDEARCAILECSGAPGSAATVICPALSKVFVVKNAVTGGFAVTLKTSAGTGISVANGATALLYCDGTNVVTGATATSFSGGSTGLTPNTATTGAVTLAGTLAVANGGTGVVTSTGTGSTVLSISPALVTPALGTPTSGVVTNLTGTASINVNGTVGATTPAAGAFTTLAASSTISGAGFSAYFAAPPALGTTTPAEVKVTVGWAANTVLTDAATVAWDTTNQVATFTFVSTNRTFGAPTNLRNGAFYALAVIQNAGSNTLTWNSVFKWAAGVAPTLSTAAGAKDYFTFRSDGTNLYQQGISQAVA